MLDNTRLYRKIKPAALQTSAAEVRQSCRDATCRCLVSMAVLRAWHALVADARHVMQTVAQRKDVEVLLESQKQRALLLLGGRQTQRPLLRILRVWNGLSRERHWRLRIVQLVYTSLLSQSTAILRHCWNLWQSRLHQKSCQRDCVNFLQGGTDALTWCWRGWKSWHVGQRRCKKALGLSRRYVEEGSLPNSFHAWRTQCLLARRENFLRLAERLRGLRGFLESSSAVSGRLLLAFALRSWRLAPEAMREQRRLLEARGAAAQELLLRRFLGAWRRGVLSQHRQHRSRLGELAEVKEHQERLAKMLSKRDEQMRSLGVVPWLSGRPIEISGPLVKLMLARWRGWAHQVSGDRRHLLGKCLHGWRQCSSRRRRAWAAGQRRCQARLQERRLLRSHFGRWLVVACWNQRLQSLRRHLWPLFEGVHRAVVTTLVFYRWRCWSRRPERVPEVGANMYSHDSCPVPVRMLQQRAETELAFRAWRSIPRRREASRKSGGKWMEASAASELWAWAARLHAQVARARLARRAAHTRQAAGLPAPAQQTLQSIIEDVLAQARTAALLAAWRWVVQDAEPPEPPERSQEDAGREAREVLSLCQMLEWQNADMQSLLQERAMENARLEAELRKQTSPLQR
eukprot:s5873_g3.t1